MNKVNIEINRSSGSAWVSGNYDGHLFDAKVYNLPSNYGVNGGRVSKIIVGQNYRPIHTNYDRGWDIRPTKPDDVKALEAILEALEAMPTY